MTKEIVRKPKVSPAMDGTQRACVHAWVLNVKPAVCLWCGARKQPRGKR